MHITIEIKDAKQFEIKQPEVLIFMDEKGLDAFLLKLTALKEGKTDHFHLMSSSWGGKELSEKTHAPENCLVNHLKVIYQR